jgi:hypothetical protein
MQKGCSTALFFDRRNLKAVIILPTMSRQEISTRQKVEPARRSLPQPATSLAPPLLAANVADVEVNALI